VSRALDLNHVPAADRWQSGSVNRSLLSQQFCPFQNRPLGETEVAVSELNHSESQQEQGSTVLLH